MKAGRFLMSKEMYDSDWKELSGVFKIFKPFEIKYSYEDKGWWFVGTSESFDEVCIVDMMPDHMPQYKLIVVSHGTNKDNMVYEFVFRKEIKDSQYFCDQADIIVSVTRNDDYPTENIKVLKNKYKPD